MENDKQRDKSMKNEKVDAEKTTKKTEVKDRRSK